MSAAPTEICPDCNGIGYAFARGWSDAPSLDVFGPECTTCEGEGTVAKTECEGCGATPVAAVSPDGLFVLCACCAGADSAQAVREVA